MEHRLRRAVLCAVLSGLPALARTEDLPLSDGKWQLEGKSIAVARFEDRETIAVETGRAFRRDLKLLDGSIEFDVRLTRRRSFVYLAFRMETDGEHEEIYLRPHKSGLPDAIQYAPVYQGQSGWQLFHGPGATAAAEFEPGAWTHVRLLLRGRQAALFVGPGAVPALVVPHLHREPRAGYIALRGFLGPGATGSGPVAHFANVTVRPGPVAFDFPVVPAAPLGPGVIRAWSVSRSFLPPAAPVSLPPADVLGTFRRVDSDPSGLVSLHRAVAMPKDSRDTAAVARVRLRVPRDGVHAFELGFSDQATVFLNGRPLFAGEASFSVDHPRREGLIGYDQARLFLPLVSGDNDLAVLVSDGFGGWGLMGRFPDADVEVTTP